MLLDEHEAQKIFSSCIFDMLFDKDMVSSIQRYEFDAISIRANPKKFILDMIQERLASKALNEKDAEVLRVYAMKSGGKTNVDVYEALNPHVPREDILEFRSLASSRITKCPALFKRLGIPYIPWKTVSDGSFTEKNIESIIRQVKDFYETRGQ